MSQVDLLVRSEPVFTSDPLLKRVGLDPNKALRDGAPQAPVTRVDGQELPNAKASLGGLCDAFRCGPSLLPSA
jgi:hypothetical protein